MISPQPPFHANVQFMGGGAGAGGLSSRGAERVPPPTLAPDPLLMLNLGGCFEKHRQQPGHRSRHLLVVRGLRLCGILILPIQRRFP